MAHAQPTHQTKMNGALFPPRSRIQVSCAHSRMVTDARALRRACNHVRVVVGDDGVDVVDDVDVGAGDVDDGGDVDDDDDYDDAAADVDADWAEDADDHDDDAADNVDADKLEDADDDDDVDADD